MKIAFLTCVGPSHESFLDNCVESSEVAFRVDRGMFSEMRHFVLDDTEAYYGRPAARNVLLGQAHGWGADWIMFVDVTDIVHPRGLRNLTRTIERDPDLQYVIGCLSLWWNHSDAIKHDVGSPGKTQHMYRSPFDLAPISWDDLIEHKNQGTIGTHTACRMDLAWKIGCRPDLPAAELFEFSHVAMACGKFEKIKHPLIVINRSAGHSNKADDPGVNHGPQLNEAISAVNAAWGERGRVPLTYEELEERWDIRRFRAEDLYTHLTMQDMDEFTVQKEF